MSLDVYLKVVRPCTIYNGNVTHNLQNMAEAAGILMELWHPEEIGITLARQLIEPLTAAVARLKAEPDKFRALNPPNGWGSYAGLLEFMEQYLQACSENPEAEVSVWR